MSEVPDATARVAGARSWRIANTMWARLGGLLWAHAMLEPWPVGEYEAACSLTTIPHEIPGEHCTCGVWAPTDYRHVSGIVSGAGVMWLHEAGWRAQRAKVEAIFLDDIPEEMLPTTKREIASAYDVPIIHPEQYEEFCEERGLLVITDEDL